MRIKKNAISRRNFVSRTLQTTVGVALVQSLPAGLLGAERAEKGVPRLGFTTYTWGKDWDVPALIANLQKAGIFGVELRTSASYAHKVELTSSAGQRSEVRKQFAASPVKLVGIASGERLDWPEAAKLKTAVENAKGFVKLSSDVGSSGVRVFPNQFNPNVPHEKTIEQIARALNELGAFARDYNQEIRLEAHGGAGDLRTIRAIMDRVTQPNVRVKLNSDARDGQGQAFEANFNSVKNFLGQTVHLHNLKDKSFPYQLQTDLLVKMQWSGWALLELSDKVTDRIQGLIEQRNIWETLVASALKKL